MFQVTLATRRLVRTLSALLQVKRLFSRKEPSYDREEVENYYCQSFVWRSCVNSGLQNGYKNGASLRSR